MSIWAKNTYLMFFFLLQCFSVFMSLVSEKWFMVFLALELSMFSIIPLMVNLTKSFILKFFVVKVSAGIFLLLGQLLINPNLFLLGLFMKLSAFPLIWFPYILSKDIPNYLLLWMLTVQKLPVYILWNEFLLVKDWLFFILLSITLMFSGFQMFKSSSLLFLLGWKSVIHSSLNVLILNYLSFKIFLLCFFSYSLILSLYLLLFNSSSKENIWNSSANLLIYFSLAGLPLFVKVIFEMILFFVLQWNWIFVIIVSLILQMSGFVSFFSKTSFFKSFSKNAYLLIWSAILLFLLLGFFLKI